MATIMSDEVFHDVAYKAKKREHLLAGIDEFLGKWWIEWISCLYSKILDLSLFFHTNTFT